MINNSEKDTTSTHSNSIKVYRIPISNPKFPKNGSGSPVFIACGKRESLPWSGSQVFIACVMDWKQYGRRNMVPKHSQTTRAISEWRKRWPIFSTAGFAQHLHHDTMRIPLALIQLSTRTACFINFPRKVAILGGRVLCQSRRAQFRPFWTSLFSIYFATELIIVWRGKN